MEVLDDQRKVGVGDRMSLRIVEDRKPPVELVVTDSGEMEVPLIGRVTARGKTCKGLAFEIKKLLEKDYFHRCTVIIGLDAASNRSPGKIYLSGQIKTQGFIEIPPEETLTVSRAILRAGGFSDFANKRKVKVLRKTGNGKQKAFVVDVLQILEKGTVSNDMALEPDDLVMVPERLINF
ncbi:MAG: polysaccharide biosynthesis/export family protein [Chthoniobacteraceae bacterium]